MNSSVDLTRTFRKKLRSVARRADKRGLDFNLTPEWAVRQWEYQGGKCEYSGLSMVLYAQGRDPFSMSFDRADSSAGYLMSNVVMCCHCLNACKTNMRYGQFGRVLEGIAKTFKKRGMLMLAGEDPVIDP